MYLLLLLLNDVLTKLSAFFSEIFIYFFMKCDVSRGNWHKSTHVLTSFITFHFIDSRRRKWQPTLLFFSEESHGQRGLVDYSPESRTHKRLSMHACTIWRCNAWHAIYMQVMCTPRWTANWQRHFVSFVIFSEIILFKWLICFHTYSMF